MLGYAVAISTSIFSGAMMMCVAAVKYKRGENNAPITLFLVGLLTLCIAFWGGISALAEMTWTQLGK